MKVIFRKWKNSGRVIALFPEVPADNWGSFCQSYEHIGQHGAADYFGVMKNTKPTGRGEHLDLIRELRSLGYSDLYMAKRASFKTHELRHKTARGS